MSSVMSARAGEAETVGVAGEAWPTLTMEEGDGGATSMSSLSAVTSMVQEEEEEAARDVSEVAVTAGGG